jgi:hypothetical protein
LVGASELGWNDNNTEASVSRKVKLGHKDRLDFGASILVVQVFPNNEGIRGHCNVHLEQSGISCQ